MTRGHGRHEVKCDTVMGDVESRVTQSRDTCLMLDGCFEAEKKD